MKPNQVGLLFFHPTPSRSRVGTALFRAAQEVARADPRLKVRAVYEEYPDFFIPVEREKEFLESCDRIIFQHPFYWYSCPSLMKQWIDVTLELGWAYGEGGEALHGKTWAQALTAGGPKEVYNPNGANRFTILELLRPFERTAELCGMAFAKPFVVHSARRLKDTEIKTACDAYKKWLSRLLNDETVSVSDSRDRLLASQAPSAYQDVHE